MDPVSSPSTPSPPFYVFIISSLDHPVYRDIQVKRKTLLAHYRIPYTVLINEDESPVQDRSVPTLLPMNDDEVLFPRSGMNPYMTQKFLTAVKMYFRSFPSWESVPPYILRINATVYIHWPTFTTHVLSRLPRERVMAGPCYTEDCLPFMNGMVFVFSKDVLRKILADPRVFSKDIMGENDDVALTRLAGPHASLLNLMDHFVYPDESTTSPDGMFLLPPRNPKACLFRIAHKSASRETDKRNWDHLLSFYGEDSIVVSTVEPYVSCTRFRWGILVLIVILLIFVVGCVYMSRSMK